MAGCPVCIMQGEPIGRMVFVLFPDEAPRAAENYRQLFTGEKVPPQLSMQSGCL